MFSDTIMCQYTTYCKGNDLKSGDNQLHSGNEPQSDDSDLTNIVNGNESTIAKSLISSFDQHDYSVTQLLDDLHHIKYEHDVDGNDDRFDAAYNFFKGAMSNDGCDIDKCPFNERHYRDRGREHTADSLEDEEDLLMDMMSMIHCYFFHSFETQRFTKEERDRIMKMTGASSWDSVKCDIIGDHVADDDSDEDEDEDEKDSVNTLLMSTVTSILTSKKRRGRWRFEDEEDEQPALSQFVDFAAMSLAVGFDEKALRDGLNEYEQDRDALIGDLIDVVYGEKAEDSAIWEKLGIDDAAKSTVFSNALFRYFEGTHLNTANLLKLFRFVIDRKRLQIDIEQMKGMMTTNNIDGRMFDKTDPEHYQNNGTFSKRFKMVPHCKVQHVRQLYTAVKKWKYVEWKEVAVESKEEEKEECEAEDNVVEEQVHSGQPDVYAIGKRFLFWKSQRKKKTYIEAKHGNMKEEVLQNPLLSVHFPGIKGWNKLVKIVNAMIGTKAALKVTSSGNVYCLYLS